MRRRVELLVEHGADVNAPFVMDAPRPSGRVNGNTEIVELLVARGAPAPPRSPVDGFVGAVLAADRVEVSDCVPPIPSCSPTGPATSVRR